MNNYFLLFYSPKLQSQVRILIYRNWPIVICISFLQVPSDILPMKDMPVKVDGQGCALMQVGVFRVVVRHNQLGQVSL